MKWIISSECHWCRSFDFVSISSNQTSLTYLWSKQLPSKCISPNNTTISKTPVLNSLYISSPRYLPLTGIPNNGKAGDSINNAWHNIHSLLPGAERGWWRSSRAIQRTMPLWNEVNIGGPSQNQLFHSQSPIWAFPPRSHNKGRAEDQIASLSTNATSIVREIFWSYNDVLIFGWGLNKSDYKHWGLALLWYDCIRHISCFLHFDFPLHSQPPPPKTTFVPNARLNPSSPILKPPSSPINIFRCLNNLIREQQNVVIKNYRFR